MKSWVILPILMLMASPFAQGEPLPVVGEHPGYVFDVEKEKNQHDEPLVLIQEPAKLPQLKEKLFDEKLTKDIREQYEFRFGHSALEQSLNAPASRDQSFYYRGDTTVTYDKFQQYQQSFGQYVGRRVMETQFDNFFKSEPSLKTVYQIKDKVSNPIDIQTKAGYKFKFRYNISGGSLDMELENPYHVELKAQIQFKPFSELTEEETISAGYKINKLYTVSSYYKFYDSLVQLVGSRVITSSVSANVTGSTTTNDGNGPSIRQNMVLVGISWTQ
jgi:hypothetical protein